MPKPIALDEPYPTLENVTADCVSLRIISSAYATPVGELNAVLQYVYHSFFFKGYGYKDISDLLMGIAIAEMRHLNLLGNTIFALGSAPTFTQYPPVFFNFYSTKYISSSRTLQEMLEDDVLGERRAISQYKRMLCSLKNDSVCKIVSRILGDEELHLKLLEEALADFKG